jgi:CheY-like chemotaxis protein
MRILAVEDEPEYLEMLQDVVKSVGHSITIASNGREALKLLEREKVDVIVSDVAMPQMDGIEFHARLRLKPEFANTPFIFLTGVADVGAVKAVCQPDRDLVLQKPFPVDHLIQIFAGRLR